MAWSLFCQNIKIGWSRQLFYCNIIYILVAEGALYWSPKFYGTSVNIIYATCFQNKLFSTAFAIRMLFCSRKYCICILCPLCGVKVRDLWTWCVYNVSVLNCKYCIHIILLLVSHANWENCRIFCLQTEGFKQQQLCARIFTRNSQGHSFFK